MVRMTLLALWAAGCDCSGHRVDSIDEGDLGSDGDSDTDTDTDSDGDSDTDTDSDSGSDTDTATASESDGCDVDGDLYVAVDCGGDDCDDDDASIHPCAADGGSWHIERVDAGNSHQGGSLAIEPDGTLAAASWNQTDLLFHSKDAAGWATEVVDADGTYPSLAIDEEGEPHVAFTALDSSLRIATRDGAGGWDVEVIDDDGVDVWCPSLHLAPDGSAEIAYIGPGELRYASNAGGAWVTEVIDTGSILGAIVARNPLAEDASGDRHVAYTVDLGGGLTPDYELRLASRHAGSWSIESLERGDAAGQQATLLADAVGGLDLFFVSQNALGTLDLVHQFGAPGSWTRERLADVPDVVNSLSSALDASGAVHLSHVEVVDRVNLVDYTTNESGEWITEHVNGVCEGGFGTWTSIALSDDVHILFADEGFGAAALAHAYPVDAVADGIDQDCDGAADE